MERRVRWKSHARCKVGEDPEITYRYIQSAATVSRFATFQAVAQVNSCREYWSRS